MARCSHEAIFDLMDEILDAFGLDPEHKRLIKSLNLNFTIDSAVVVTVEEIVEEPQLQEFVRKINHYHFDVIPASLTEQLLPLIEKAKEGTE